MLTFIGEVISIYPLLNQLSLYTDVVVDQLKTILEILNGKS
jgi:hypothetical protein